MRSVSNSLQLSVLVRKGTSMAEDSSRDADLEKTDPSYYEARRVAIA